MELSDKQQFALQQWIGTPATRGVLSQSGKDDVDDAFAQAVEELRSQPVAFLERQIDRLPEHLLRDLFSSASQSKHTSSSTPTPAERSAVKRITQRRRHFFRSTAARGTGPSLHATPKQPAYAAEGSDSADQRPLNALEEELSLRWLRSREPLLYERLVGSMALGAGVGAGKDQEAEEGLEDEGLPPPLATATPQPAPSSSSGGEGAQTSVSVTKGAAFSRYLRRIDDEDAQLALDRKREAEEEVEEEEGDDVADGQVGAPEDHAAGVQAFLDHIQDRFVRGDESIFSRRLYDWVDFDESLDTQDDVNTSTRTETDMRSHPQQRQGGGLRAVTDEDRWFDDE